MSMFNEQYPARPEQAFIASGTPAYSAERIMKLLEGARANPPVWRGDIMMREKIG